MKEPGSSDSDSYTSVSICGIEYRVFLNIELSLGSRYPVRGKIFQPPLQPDGDMQSVLASGVEWK